MLIKHYLLFELSNAFVIIIMVVKMAKYDESSIKILEGLEAVKDQECMLVQQIKEDFITLFGK